MKEIILSIIVAIPIIALATYPFYRMIKKDNENYEKFKKNL